jgi:hypothetical protein
MSEYERKLDAVQVLIEDEIKDSRVVHVDLPEDEIEMLAAGIVNGLAEAGWLKLEAVSG